MKILALLFAVAFVACQTPLPSPVPPPDVTVVDAGATDEPEAGPALIGDAEQGDIFDRACDRLAAFRCKDGLHPACAAIMRRVDLTNLTRMNSTCLAGARSVGAIRACGSFCRAVVP